MRTFETRSTRPEARTVARVATVIAVTLVCHLAPLRAQSLTARTEDGAVRVQASGFRFLDGEPLSRLKDGQPVRVELELAVLAKPGAAAASQRRQTFVLSYDLWEERFAVTLADEPSRSVSHLTPVAAEAWCIRQLAVPVSALGALGPGATFWVRIASRVRDGDGEPTDDSGFTLQGLIDVLSRRRKNGDTSRALEGGPFRLP